MELIGRIDIKNSGDRLVVSWEWNVGGDATVEIYAKSWRLPDDSNPGILLHRERKLDSYAVSSVNIVPNAGENGIYHLILIPYAGGAAGSRIVRKNIAIGPKRVLTYRLSGKGNDMTEIRFDFPGPAIPGSHFRALCRGGHVLPFLTDIGGKDSFLMCGVGKDEVKVEIAPDYRDCYVLREG